MTNTMNTPPRFGEWAAVVSQRTNRSLAGRRITLPPATRHDADAADSGRAWRQFRSEAAQWGMIASDADVHAAHSPDACTPAGGDAPLDPRCPVTQLFDSRHAAGVAAMDYAQEHMPVTVALLKTLTGETDLDGVRIAVCLILEPKTAVLLRLLQAAGATVGVYCEPESTDQRVADQLRREGIMVQADAGWTAEQAHQGALRLLDEIRPQIIIDDGASFARLAALERPQLLDDLVGVSEETTSGVRAFEAMRDAGALTFPVIAVNDSILKTGFDNAHGTGETCVTTMQDILGARAFDGARVTVVGYGPVGRGFAMRIRTLGAQVTICDTNPVAALRAVFDGFAATDIDEALPQSDIVVSATGVRHTIALEHLRRMRQGTALAVIGGIANEIALDDIPDFHGEPGTRIRDLAVPEGPVIRLLAEGDGVNYTAGGGNPIEIMDLSFAVQVSAVDYLWRTRGTLAPGLHRLDADADRRIAAMALSVRGFRASHAVADNGYDWTLTRFAETERRSRTQEGR
ncbi:adenosylhomocysteinase [Bifidobacterium pullorum]|uniref:adenosylhomocysteinase n=1 Tax=Bifidobacterium pullorum TaxID=78448 RepID=UPI0009DF2D4A|nr:adenosylhomocysteinase [Bifidobacterium pullorum]